MGSSSFFIAAISCTCQNIFLFIEVYKATMNSKRVTKERKDQVISYVLQSIENLVSFNQTYTMLCTNAPMMFQCPFVDKVPFVLLSETLFSTLFELSSRDHKAYIQLCRIKNYITFSSHCGAEI